MTAFAEQLESVRETAAAEIGPLRRPGSTPVLYRILADCLALVERCQANPADHAELRERFMARPAAGNRRFVERRNEVWNMVTRYVFEPINPAERTHAARANACRYAMALREAQAKGIGSQQIFTVLSEEGGINALFLARPLERTKIATKALRLRDQIEYPKGGTIRLVLRHLPDNTHEVVSVHVDDAGAA